jgi:DNA-binding MarR family transcriptional regulator
LSEINASNGRATVSKLAQTLGREVHTLTSAVNGLENKKFVMRHSIKGEDRRIVRIAATQPGTEALRAFRKSVESVIDAVRSGPFDGEPSRELKHATAAMMRLLTESK